ncbi:MAG: dipeptidase [Paludibacter sp.]|nr:dipeptidase [Paludibacter sp.]
MTVKDYVHINEDAIFDKLFSLIRIPSVSAHADKKNEIVSCANLWANLLKGVGMSHVEVISTKGNPVVYAEYNMSESVPTVLIYGHYDVMPAEPLYLWASDPFTPEIRNDKIYARGADDDKGQSFMHYVAFEYLLKSNELNCNVKFILEGEEEIGSPNLEEFCRTNADMLKCDTVLVSDTSMLGADLPSITTGLRGLAYWQIEVSSANRDLHSGIFGGAVANPINELTKILAQLIDADGKITIPGFYDDVVELSEEEKALLSMIPFDETTYKKSLGITAVHGEKGYTTLERTGVRPTFDICGIWGGYTGDGAKTVLPAKAFAKISTRLVPEQHSGKISVLVSEYIKSIAPDYVDVNIEYLHGAESYVCPIDSIAYQAAEAAYTTTFGRRPLPVRRGGSIGVVPVFEKELKVKPILMGFGLEEDAIHSPNENFSLDMFYKGIETIVEFYRNYAR